MTQSAPDSPAVPTQSDGTVHHLARGGTPPSTRPIAGTKAGWLFRTTDRTILHRRSDEGSTLPIGTVPVVLGRVTYRMSDRRHTRIGYLLQTSEGPRIATAEQVLDGTWADLCGRDRPTTPDERHAYARILSEDVRTAPERPAMPVKGPDGGLELPEADAQELGYLRTGDPDQVAAREGWRRVLTAATFADRTTLALSAAFCGPLVSSLPGVPAHVLNLCGDGQQGKSTAQRIMAAMLGDPTDTGEIMGTMNSTGLALPETLIQARYLPMCREETSSSALSAIDLERLLSRVVAGGRRARLGQGGALRPSAGTWHSILITSSNESLLRPGQVEALASRLIQLSPPFFAGAPDAQAAQETALQYHGWPLVWAQRAEQFTGERVAEWRRLHGEIVGRLTTADGGIPLTLGRIVAAWCVGGYMLGEILGMPEVGARAEEDARTELPRILGDTAETHLTPGQVLWEAVAGAIAQEPSAWVTSGHLTTDSWSDLDGFRPRRILGYYHQGRVHAYVATVKDAARAAGLDSPVPGLKDLQRRGVLKTEERTKLASKHPTRELRNRVPGRVYVFDTAAAQEAFADRENPPNLLPAPAVPADDSATVAAEQRAMTAPAVPAATPTRDVVTSRRRDVTVPPMPSQPPTVGQPVVYPPARRYEPGDNRIDAAWLALESRATGRTRSALAVGVLGDGTLYLPHHEPVAVPMPGTVDQVPALMREYGLRTLWVHDHALGALGLPTYDQRREAALAALPEGAPPVPPGPQSPTPHPWVTLGADSPIREVAPDGLATWMTLILHSKSDERAPRLSVSIPAYDTRFDKAGQPGRGGWGGAPTPEALLDALMVYLTSTAHGLTERPKVIPYYLSPNRTGEDFAGGRGRDDVLCHTIRDGHVPPAVGNRVPVMVPQKWSRTPDDGERDGWLHQYDKVAAWLAAYGPTKLGVGEPTHGGEGTPYDRRYAGYWRIAEVPGRGPEGLPELVFRKAEQGGYWVTTPSMELLREVYPEWVPVVLEAWYWEHSKAALSGMYKLLSTSRKRIVAAAEQGRPGARWAKQVNGRIYQSFRGYLARAGGPQTDHATGGDYRPDIYYRPDWARMILDQATANMYRNLLKFAAEGRRPLSVYVDAVTYASPEQDPQSAKPGAMTIGTGGGQWSLEGSAPMANLLPLMEGGQSAHTALDTYLSTQGGDD